jgi:hypothetical protein
MEKDSKTMKVQIRKYQEELLACRGGSKEAASWGIPVDEILASLENEKPTKK